MEIYHGLSSFIHRHDTVLTTGTFDGVHRGHRSILARLKQEAQAHDGKATVLTFWPHPRGVVASEAPRLLNTLEEKLHLLEACGMDRVLVMPFTRELAEYDADTFLNEILIRGMGLRTFVIGYDHRFGKGRSGDMAFLYARSATHGFKLVEIPRQDIDDAAVSSTRIRTALAEGRVEEAHDLLGDPYTLSGLVVHGKKLGRTLGYPTANMMPDLPEKLIPAVGIYAVKVVVKGRTYGGMLSIGFNPTVGGTGLSIEAHILRFDEDIYGERIMIIFVQRLRNEMKFDGLPQLVAQMDQDKLKTEKILATEILAP